MDPIVTSRRCGTCGAPAISYYIAGEVERYGCYDHPVLPLAVAAGTCVTADSPTPAGGGEVQPPGRPAYRPAGPVTVSCSSVCGGCGALVADEAAHTRFHSILAGHAWALSVLKTAAEQAGGIPWPPGELWAGESGWNPAGGTPGGNTAGT